MTEMLGYDKRAAHSFILKRLPQKQFAALADELPLLTMRLIDAHLGYLHACGALDEDGDTGNGAYDEDEAFEYMLEAVSNGADEERLNALALLIEAFLPAQEVFMEREGLVSEGS